MEEKIEDGLDEKFKKNIWRDILKEFRKEKKLLIVSLLASFMLGFFEVGLTFTSKYIIDAFVVHRNATYFLPLIILAGCLVFVCFIITFIYIWFAGHMEANVLHNLRMKVFNKYQELSLSFYDANATGHLLARITSDIGKIGDVLSWGLVDFVWQIVTLTFTFIAMLLLNVKLTLIALVTVPLIMIAAWMANKTILRRNRVVSKLNSSMIATYQENIHGVLTAKTFLRENINDREFRDLTRKLRKASIRAAGIMAFMPLMLGLISSIGVVLVNMTGSIDVMNNVITIGTLVAFSALLSNLTQPISWFVEIFTWIISTQPSVERVMAILDAKVTIEDSDEAKALYGNEKLENEIINGDIKFEDVSFEYKKGESVLEGFNLDVKKGESVALVGATGAGKTTIVNLFCHFYEPIKGHITIGGKDYKDIPQSWIHNHLGYVLQTPYLFTGSIMENIRYGNINAKDDEIINALKLIGASSFIEELKDGYNTHLGEDGAILSTGQKQLLSLARILVRDPKFFVLDEATSYIDTQTEEIVQKAIEITLKNRTSFIVAHRLSTIKNASKIVVIEKGKIVEMGDHKELIAKGGAYYAFYTKELSENVRNHIG